MSDCSYEVFGPSGQPMMVSAAGIRYPREIELSMLDAGYTIKINGRKLTKTELRRNANATSRADRLGK